MNRIDEEQEDLTLQYLSRRYDQSNDTGDIFECEGNCDVFRPDCRPPGLDVSPLLSEELEKHHQANLEDQSYYKLHPSALRCLYS